MKFLVVWLNAVTWIRSEQNFQSPKELVSNNGILETVLTFEANTITIPNSDIVFTSRFFNGSFPGPTIRLKPGDTLNLTFYNNLNDQNLPYVTDKFSAPDETNIHCHGLHVSGEEPSDDGMLHINPGESYEYEIKLPDDHIPGTHWLHPHRHGSTSLQVGGGAASAIIVDDIPGTLPQVVEDATEVIFLVQEFDIREMNQVVEQSKDNLFKITARNSFLTVNGMLNPTIEIFPGKWIRLRIIYATWLENLLNLVIVPNCEMFLLAKDGIYINDFPRRIDTVPLAAGGRADLMIRCMESATTFEVFGQGKVIATIKTLQSNEFQLESQNDLQPWTPIYPPYLADLQSTSATPGCSCTTKMDNNAINGKPFRSSDVFHVSYIGSVVERTIRGRDHPYHQHVYPFQVQSGFEDNNNYYKAGDWHDTVLGNGIIKFQPQRFPGKLMIHCHRLDHEDKGMMALEMIESNEDNQQDQTCSCIEQSRRFESRNSSAAKSNVIKHVGFISTFVSVFLFVSSF